MSDTHRMTRRMGLRTAMAAAVTVPLMGTLPASAAKPSNRRLDVMTFNLRFASTSEPNSWAARRPVMRRLLRQEAPTLMGTQEGLYQQLRDIHADLGPHYDWIGTGREGGSHDESTAIFYDTRRLAPVEHDTYWLSDTPRVIGSNTWGGALPGSSHGSASATGPSADGSSTSSTPTSTTWASTRASGRPCSSVGRSPSSTARHRWW